MDDKQVIQLSRPHQLLQLLALAFRAAHAAIGLVSAEGELQEHLTCGVNPDGELEARYLRWSGELIRFIGHQAAALRIADFSQALLPGGIGPATPPPLATGPLLGVPLGHGRCRGALYLARAPGQSPFRERELETILPVCTWLEHGSFFEEARLLAQLRLLNQVAQAAAGSLDQSRIVRVALGELARHLPQHICIVWLLDNRRRAALAEDEPERDPAASAPPAFLVLNTLSPVTEERLARLGLAPGLRLPLGETRFASCLHDGKAQYVDLGKLERDERPAAGQESASLAPEKAPGTFTPSPAPGFSHLLGLERALSPYELRLRQRGARFSFAVPLRAGDEAVGVLQSICTRASGLTNEQIQLLYLVADLLGPAISNCQFYRRLRAAYEELRTAQSQLIQAEKMRALGELAGGMAHDFNNSLCGVLGFLELALADKDLDPTIAGYLELARTCTLDAAQTVRRVQDFARWQRKELSIQLLDFNQLVRQTLELTRHKWESLAHARGAPITVQVETAATERVSGSPAELREILTNLVFNAVDAMPQGGRLSVRTWSTASDLYLSVGDTGIGMSDSTRRRLFEPFFTTKGERGNGLGLSVTFGIVQRYGGEITVDSEPDRGSTFLVRLPLQARGKDDPADRDCPRPEDNAAVGPADREKPRPAPAGPASPAAKSLRILVVEDEQPIRGFLTQALAQLGHSARTAADAQEGLAVFLQERFDLVLTDLGLPGMSGEELARTVARKAPGTPVILLSGWSTQLQDEARPLAGVTRVLAKPITLATLAAALAAIQPK